jgi:preprotein translocase YajC subunit
MLFAVHMLSATKSKGSGSSLFLLAIVAIYAGVYFFYFRPRSQKNKAARLASRKVELGERAQTIGGFVGTVIKMEDGLVTLRGASGVELDFITSAIAKRFDPPTPVAESSDDEPTEEGDKK